MFVDLLFSLGGGRKKALESDDLEILKGSARKSETAKNVSKFISAYGIHHMVSSICKMFSATDSTREVCVLRESKKYTYIISTVSGFFFVYIYVFFCCLIVKFINTTATS